jgi:putative nucleotidyltransferase with HDIG domain
MRCPGQDSRYWKFEAVYSVPCAQCGSLIEFFKDEPTRRCKKCGHQMVNPKMDFGCAAYCKYAEQCLGNLPLELIAQKKELLKDRVAVEMKHFFKRDFKRIGHATRVARHAEQIAREEKGDLSIVLTSAYLHDIGTEEAEARYGNHEAQYHEELGPPIAREILIKLGAAAELIEEVCDIVGHHHHLRAEETVNFKAVYDADMIVHLEENQQEAKWASEKLAGIIEKDFLTETGRKLARKTFLTAEIAENAEKNILAKNNGHQRILAGSS